MVVSAYGLSPRDPAFRASPADDRDHVRPVLAAVPAGALLVWQGVAPATGNYEILAHPLSDVGDLPATPLILNEVTAGNQRRPAVAAAADGSFVAAWDGAGSAATQGVFVRRFAADRTPLAAAQLVDAATGQFAPSIALTPDGGMVVAWHGVVAGDPLGVAFRRYSATGAPLDATPRLPYSGSDVADSDQTDAAVAVDSDGTMLLAWETYALDLNTFAATYTVQMRRYSADGNPLEPVITLASGDDADGPGDPAVGFTAAGRPVVAWVRANGRVEAALPGLPGLSAPSPITLAAANGLSAVAPVLAFDGSGGTTVAWPDPSSTASGPLGIAARRIAASGQLGDLFYPALPETTTLSDVAMAALAPASAGLWLAWQNDEVNLGAPVGVIYGLRLAEPAVELSAVEPLQVVEGGAFATVEVQLSTLPAREVMLTLTPQNAQLALNGNPAGGPLTLTFTPANARIAQQVQIMAVDDALAEGPQQVMIDLALSGDPGYAAAPLLLNGIPVTALTVDIVDNDTSRYGVNVAPLRVDEGNTGTTPATFTISRTGAIDSAGSVRYTFSGAVLNRDYRILGGLPQSGALNFAPGETTRSVQVEIIGNTAVDGDRSLLLTLSDPQPNGLATIGTATATLLITDDDTEQPPPPEYRLYLPIVVK